jgi:hypothetical protein
MGRRRQRREQNVALKLSEHFATQPPGSTATNDGGYLAIASLTLHTDELKDRLSRYHYRCVGPMDEVVLESKQ